MKNSFTQKVFYSDTDAYGVVWHGSYLRWLEMGRVLLCEDLGYNLVELQNQDITLPVTNINVRYKSSAKLNDEIIVETEISKVTPLSVTFSQTITNKSNNKVCIKALVDVVAVNNQGKLYRRFPDILNKLFERGLECK